MDVKLTLAGKLVDAIIADDPYRRRLIRGEDLWVKILPITKDTGDKREQS
jgi:hypothetical protein